jgi:hypothetical protein
MPFLQSETGGADRENARRNCMLTKPTTVGITAKFCENAGSGRGSLEKELRVVKGWVDIAG